MEFYNMNNPYQTTRKIAFYTLQAKKKGTVFRKIFPKKDLF